MLIIIGTNTVVTEMGNSNFRISGHSHYFTKLSGNFHGKKMIVSTMAGILLLTIPIPISDEEKK